MTSPQLSFSRPVAKGLVHKFAVSEVFPTDFRSMPDDGRFLAAVALPRRHALFRPLVKGVDAHLIMEAARQLILLISHEAYSIPRETPFLFAHLEGTFSDAFPAADGQDLPEVTVDVRFEGTPGLDRASRAYRVVLLFVQRDRVFARVSVDSILVRGSKRQVQPPVVGPLGCTNREGLLSPSAVGVVDPCDVVLRRCVQSRELLLSLDLENPLLFDHPVDHVPGMVMFEACRQVCRAMYGPDVEISDIDIRFERVACLEKPTIVRLAPEVSSGRYLVTFVRDNIVCATAKVKVRGAGVDAVAVQSERATPRRRSLVSPTARHAQVLNSKE